jgi:hypothetical protein
MATNEEMIELLKEIRSGLKNEIEIKDMQYLLHYFWRSDIPIIDSILAELSEKSPNEKLVQAVKDYLEWGPMTGSDRDLHESKFRKVLESMDQGKARRRYKPGRPVEMSDD